MAYLYQVIQNVPGLTGTAAQRQKALYDRLGAPMGAYTGSAAQNNWLLTQINKGNVGSTPAAAPASTQVATAAVPSKTLAEEYAAPFLKTAPTIPQWENVLPWENLKAQFAPTFQQVGAEQVTPEIAREFNRSRQGFIGNLANTGGGSFGGAWGGLGNLQAGAERMRKEQMMNWTDMMNQGLNTWYQNTGQAYGRARDAGDVYNYTVPKWQDFASSFNINPTGAPVDYSQSPFLNSSNSQKYLDYQFQ